MKGGVQGHGFIVQGVTETPSFCFSTFPTLALSAEGIERAAQQCELNNKQTHTERYVENILAVRVQPVIKTQWVLCGMFESTLSAYLCFPRRPWLYRKLSQWLINCIGQSMQEPVAVVERIQSVFTQGRGAF